MSLSEAATKDENVVKDEENGSGGEETAATWVQCNGKGCGKWRRVPGHAKLPGRWYCRMNTWDPVRASCDAPEETARRSVET